MRLRKTHQFLWVACLAALYAPVFAEAEPATGQLEINQYRFSRHAGSYDRLVLEFNRKDATSNQPQVRVEQTGGAWNISVDNASLLGAIPESLINDSFKKKSRYLSEVTVNADSARSFVVAAKLKPGSGNHIEAFWLNAPARLVIDSYGEQKHAVEKREAASVHVEPKPEPKVEIERQAKFPGFAHLSCFPATSRVGLTVVFQPDATEGDQMQNYRINTDGIGGSTQPAADAIHCYPKKSQIKAELSYEAHRPSPFSTQGKTLFTPLPPAFSSLNPMPSAGAVNLLPKAPAIIAPPPIGHTPLPPMGALATSPILPAAPATLSPLPTPAAPVAPAAKPPALATPSDLSSLVSKAPLSPMPMQGLPPAPPLRANSSIGLPSLPGLPPSLIPAPKAEISDLDLDPGPIGGFPPAPVPALPKN
jgi:hypothetical protein